MPVARFPGRSLSAAFVFPPLTTAFALLLFDLFKDLLDLDLLIFLDLFLFLCDSDFLPDIFLYYILEINKNKY